MGFSIIGGQRLVAFFFDIVAVGLEDLDNEILEGQEKHEKARGDIDPQTGGLFTAGKLSVSAGYIVQAHTPANMAGNVVELHDEDPDDDCNNVKDECAELPIVVEIGDRATLPPDEESD